ncbi:MAG TPA: thioesterase family protein [Gemmatimonadaceae bacterium]|nr:thioesterase family protein [Gemmatimonadaceae bacterium]
MTEPVRSWRSEVRVRYAETDQMGVAYHANYLVWCEVGRTDLIRALHGSYRDVEKQGIGLAVAEANVRYHAPARYEDVLVIDTTVEAVASRTVTFAYRIAQAESGERLATASTMLICIDSAGRVTTLPPELRRALEQAVTPGA